MFKITITFATGLVDSDISGLGSATLARTIQFAWRHWPSNKWAGSKVLRQRPTWVVETISNRCFRFGCLGVDSMWEFAIEQRVPKCELFVSVRKRDVFVSCNKLRFLLTDVFFRLNSLILNQQFWKYVACSPRGTCGLLDRRFGSNL